MKMSGSEENGKDFRTGSGSALSLLRAFFIGCAMSVLWGIVSHALGLQRLFPSEAGEKLFSFPLPLQLLFYTILSPLAEEFLFRWLLFDLACRAVRRRTAALIVSALFALWHGDPVQMLYAFPAGLILQELRNRSGRMGEPVLCHAGANLTAILVKAGIGM